MIASRKGRKLPDNGHLTRRNHYVPVWYQRKFLPAGQNSLCYLDLKPEEIILPDGQKILSNSLQIWGPKKCFRETDLYTTTVFGKLNDEIERFLFGEIDRKGPTAIEALLTQDWKTLSELFAFVFEYMDAQKLRSPKGLDWIASHYPQISHSDLMREMQTLRQMHCTMWVEGVMEIVTAEKSEVKFIISDHPVTVYNPAFPPDEEMCRYPNDPPTALKGSQTIFPLDSDHCFILTNLEYAKERTENKCAEYRTNVRYFAQTLTRFDTVIRNRHLNEEEIAAINFIIKLRSRRYLAAANEEWLYPEKIVKQSWNELGKVLLPPKDELWHFGGEIFVGGKDGKLLWYQDEYGRNYNEKDKKYRIEDDLPIRERNLILWNAINEIFGFSEGKDWNDIRLQVNDDKIRELYKVYSWLWPQDTDLMSLLPVPGESLRALYNGIIDPRVILPNVMGCALYTDQIILISPFVNPWNIATKYNPIDSPSQYRDQTLKNIGLMIQMLPLIDAGIVEMIPNPCDFDSHLRKNVWQMAQERLRGWKPGKEDLEEVEPLYKNDYLNLLLSLPQDHLKHHLRSALPEISESELNNVVEYAQKLRHQDPYAPLQEMKPGENQGQLIMQSYGGNLETNFLIAQATGSYVYTNMRSKWKEIMSAHTSPNVEDTCWSAFTDILRDLPLKFLLQVDPGFVSHIRKNGKLEQIRRCLRKIYVEINKIDDSRDILRLAKGFASEIKDEYRSFQEEWKTVEVDLKKWMGKDFEPSLTTSIEGRMNLIIPPQGFKLKTIPRLIVTQKNKEQFRNSVPMAMFIDYTLSSVAHI